MNNASLPLHNQSEHRRYYRSSSCASSADCEGRAVPWHCAEAHAVHQPADMECHSGADMGNAISLWLGTVMQRYDELEQTGASVITVTIIEG